MNDFNYSRSSEISETINKVAGKSDAKYIGVELILLTYLNITLPLQVN